MMSLVYEHYLKSWKIARDECWNETELHGNPNIAKQGPAGHINVRPDFGNPAGCTLQTINPAGCVTVVKVSWLSITEIKGSD